VSARTDAAGHYAVKPYPGPSLGVTAGGAPGTPYLAAYQSIAWPAGASDVQVHVRLPRGVLVRGHVIDQADGRPVSGARVQYRPMSGRNRNGDKGNLLVLWTWLDAPTDDSGRFELPALPGKGHLLVRGPGHDYIPVEVSERELIDGRKGGGRAHFPDALVPLDPAAGADPPPAAARPP